MPNMPGEVGQTAALGRSLTSRWALARGGGMKPGRGVLQRACSSLVNAPTLHPSPQPCPCLVT